jgi:hypothetical protein
MLAIYHWSNFIVQFAGWEEFLHNEEDDGMDEDSGLIKRAILSLRKRFRISPSI